MQLQLRTGHDDRAAGVVDALAEQVLAEAALLALEHVGERLQRPVARAGDRTTTTTVVEQRVDGLLQHPLLVVDDDLGRAEVEQALEPVVPVDHAAVQVVEVGGREPATVELHHRAQVRRDDRVRRRAPCPIGWLPVLRNASTTLSRLRARTLRWPLPLAMVSRSDSTSASMSKSLEALLDRRGAHVALEVLAEPGLHLAVEHLVAHEVLDLERLEGVPHLVEAVELALRAVAQLLHLALGTVADLAPGVGLGALGLQRGEVLLELLGAVLERAVAALLEALALEADLALERGQVAVAGVLVDGGDHVGREVDDLLEVLRGQVEQVAQPARHALEVPDVGHRGGELDVAHPLAAHLGAGDLDAAALADDALEAHPLVLAAVALPVPGGTEDLLAEEAVTLGLERAVVDGLRLLDLAVAPRADVVRGGQADLKLVEEVNVEHFGCFPRSVRNCWFKLGLSRWLRLLRPSWARGGTGRCRAPRPPGRRLPRRPSSRWPSRPGTAPPR